MPAVAEAVDLFADLIPDNLIGGEDGAPAFQTVGARFEQVPRAEVNTPTELGAFADLIPAGTPSARSMEDIGQFDDLIPQPQSETERALVETPRHEEIRATRASDLPAQYAAKVSKFVDDLFAPAQDSGAKIISPEVAEVGVGLASRPARMVAAALGGKYPEAEKAVEKSLAEGVSGFSSLEGLASLPSFVIPGVAETYALGVLAKLPEQYGRIKEAIQKYGLVSAETAKAATDAGIQDLMGFLAVKGSRLVRGREQPARPASEPEPALAPIEPVPPFDANTARFRAETPAEPALPLRPEGGEITNVQRTTEPATEPATPEAVTVASERGGGIAEPAIPQEPIGITETIAKFERENAPTTEPFIPKEPPGTKFPAPGEEIMSPGPGAASAKENLASYELRRFGQRFQETEGMSPEIREATGNRYYEPISNKLTAEEASKIIDERGTDNAIRLVRDENFAMEPRVRATLAQTLVQKLNQSHAEATAAGDGARAKGFLDQAVDTAEYLGEFGTRLGQGVQSFAIWSRLTPEGMLESAKRSAKRAGVELTPEQQAEIRRLSAESHAAPEGIPKQDATKKLADYMVQKTGIPARDLPLSIYYTHILSGVNTHVVNAVDTALNVFHEVNNLAVSNPRAAASIYSGLMRGLGEGKYDGILSLQEGRRITSGKFIESPDLLEVSKFGKKGGVPIAVTGKASKVAKRLAESKIAKPLNAYKYVMRMMSASDAVFFRGAEEARAGLLAHRLAESTGVERAKLKSEAGSILGYDRLPQFRETAAKEGYTGAKAEARATELMIQSRPESLRADAADYAGVSTYNHAPRGVLGYLSNQVAQVSNKYPVLKLFVPFTRIVANVTNRGLDNTPLGILRALKEKGLSREERQRVLTRGIAGTAGIIGLGVLDATGAIKVHGAGPSDPEKKRQLRNAGWKPFSIQVGDNYFTYTYTPVGLGLSVLGNYLDSQRYNELSQKDSLTRVAYSMSRIGTTVFSQSFLSGLSNLFTILAGDPGRSIYSLKQFFSSTATAATTPNLVRDINHLFDPTARKSENIAQDLIRNIPVARLSLKPTLNAFGEPVVLSRNRFYSGQSDDPAWRVVVKQNLRVPVVDQTMFEDNDDGYLYAKIAGERMKRYINSNLKGLDRGTPQQAQDMLSKAARSIFDGARQEVINRGGKKKRKRRQ